MKKNVKQLTAVALLGFGLLSSASAADPIFSSTINNVANGSPVATADTNFTDVRGTATAQTPGAFGSGTALVLSSTTNLGNTGSRIQQNFGSTLEIMTLSMDFNILQSNAGVFNIYMGNGNTVSGNVGNNSLNDGHLMWQLQINANGVLSYRTGPSTLTATTVTLSHTTNYSLFVQVNGSASGIEYEPGKTILADSMNVFLNGELVLENIAIRNSMQNAAGMRIGTPGTDGAYQVAIDNIKVYGDIVAPIPEPATTALLLGAAASSVFFFRRRKAAKRA